MTLSPFDPVLPEAAASPPAVSPHWMWAMSDAWTTCKIRYTAGGIFISSKTLWVGLFILYKQMVVGGGVQWSVFLKLQWNILIFYFCLNVDFWLLGAMTIRFETLKCLVCVIIQHYKVTVFEEKQREKGAGEELCCPGFWGCTLVCVWTHFKRLSGQ